MKARSGKQIHVIDSNCSWIRSLVDAMDASIAVRQYRIYNPKWIKSEDWTLKALLWHKRLKANQDETYLIVPGWRRFSLISSLILILRLFPRLINRPYNHVVLFTFPIYSLVGKMLKRIFPSVRLIYHAHDPFEFYSYPSGYISQHEERLIPLCEKVFTISNELRQDFIGKFPGNEIAQLGNAASWDFLSGENAKFLHVIDRIRKPGFPVVGCVGQINSSYDWDLIETAAKRCLNTQFVFIGNLFEEGEVTERIRDLFQLENIHWLGMQPHESLPGFLSTFDICLNPMLVNAHNDRRDPLRLYDYLCTNSRIISTGIKQAYQHKEFVDIYTDRKILVGELSSIPRPIPPEDLAKRHLYIRANLWPSRAQEMMEAIWGGAK
jgi:glycosyltransferase involved in cell wall biosynthesis